MPRKRTRNHSFITSADYDDYRFKRYLVVGLGLFFCISIVVPFIHVPEKTREELEKLPPQITMFLLEKKVNQPKIMVKKVQREANVIKNSKLKIAKRKAITPKKLVQAPPVKTIIKSPAIKQSPPQQDPKNIAINNNRQLKASQDDRKVARAEASQAGVFALKQGLSELVNRDVKTNGAKSLSRVSETDVPQLNASISAISKGTSGERGVKKVKGESVSSRAVNYTTGSIARSDEGIELSDNTSMEFVNSVEIKKVKENILGVRNESSIRQTIEKNKAAIYSIYARAQRKNEDLAGKLVLEIKISPNGSVDNVNLIDSELLDKQLVRKIMMRVKMFNFGEQNVTLYTMRYTFDFVAS